jgi:hypothetical protein
MTLKKLKRETFYKTAKAPRIVIPTNEPNSLKFVSAVLLEFLVLGLNEAKDRT